MEEELNYGARAPIIAEEKSWKSYVIIMVSGLIIFFMGMSIVMAANGIDFTLYNAFYTNIGKFIATIGLGIFTIGQLVFAYSKSSIDIKFKLASLVISGIIIILLVYGLLTQFFSRYW